jgi:hypothetical protein
MWRIAFIVFLASLASACTTVRSHISVFHELDAGVAGTTYALVPFKEEEDSLEHKTYEQAVKQELNAKGFKEAPLEQAKVVVFISYGIDTGKQVVSRPRISLDTSLGSMMLLQGGGHEQTQARPKAVHGRRSGGTERAS